VAEARRPARAEGARYRGDGGWKRSNNGERGFLRCTVSDHPDRRHRSDEHAGGLATYGDRRPYFLA